MKRLLRRSFIVCALLVAACEENTPRPVAGNPSEAKSQIRFSYVDSHVAGAPPEAELSVSALGGYIGTFAANEPERAYAVFRWIRTNIAADIALASGGYVDPSTQDADAVFESRRAVCSGYAALFRALARAAGVQASVVSGYGVMTVCDRNLSVSAYNHVWNAVGIDGAWFLVETSWDPSARWDGTSDPNFFFMTPPSQFVERHLPSDSDWQLLDPPVSSDAFWTSFTQ